MTTHQAFSHAQPAEPFAAACTRQQGCLQAAAKVVVRRVDAAAEARVQQAAAASQRSDHEQRMQEHQQVCWPDVLFTALDELTWHSLSSSALQLGIVLCCCWLL